MYLIVKLHLLVLFFQQTRFCCTLPDVSKFYNNCTIRTRTDRCCDPVTAGHTACSAPTLTTLKCNVGSEENWGCKTNEMPDAGFAHPLGMMSGRIKVSHLSSYTGATQSDLSNARLFGQNGWRPSDAYLASNNIFSIPALLSVASLETFPFFFQITFERMKKISYFIIQDTNVSSTSYDQKFYLLYQNTEWRRYGSITIPEKLECLKTFGNERQSCRHILRSFRANAVKVVAADYDTTRKPRWRMEFGGLDYLEADYYWPLDKIMSRSGQTSVEIPDERGKMILKTNITSYTSTPTTKITYTNDLNSLAAPGSHPTATYTATASDQDVCLINPIQCSLGLSCSLWIKSGPSYKKYIRSQQSLVKGFSLEQTGNGFVTFKVVSDKEWITQVNLCADSSPCSLAWRHLAAVWDKTHLKLYIDGNMVRQNDGTTGAFTTNVERKLYLENLLSTRELRLWDYPLTAAEIKNIYDESTIDFTITALDNVGAWKTGVGCTKTANTGPCSDQSVEAAAGDEARLLEFQESFVDSKVSANYNCYPMHDRTTPYSGVAHLEFPYGVAMVMGFTLQIYEKFNYEEMKSFKVRFFSGGSPKMKANIYTVRLRDSVGSAQANCILKNFRRDVYNGPIVWSTGPWIDGQYYFTPNLKELVLPFLDVELAWHKYFYVVFEWITSPGTKLDLTLKSMPDYIMKGYDRRPGKYLYADATKAKHPGYPLKYTTRPIIPKMRCLTFWYHMHGIDVGILSVSMQQQPSLYKEIFRLYGNQGNFWRYASVPLLGLSENSIQFQVTFTSIRGKTTAGDIAVDTIKFKTSNCSLSPVSAAPPKYTTETFKTAMKSLHIPVPVILLPLEENLSYFSTLPLVLARDTVHTKLIADKFGFPLEKSHFDGDKASVIEVTPAYPIQNSSDFTLSFYIRPDAITESTILRFGNGNSNVFSLSLLASGNLSVKIQDENGTMQSFQSQIILHKKTWRFVCLLYSRLEQSLTMYLDEKVVDQANFSNLQSLPYPVNIFIGGENRTSSALAFKGYLSCIQFYDAALELHVINAIRLCPNKHALNICNASCKMEGVCNPVTRQCMCPSYANKHVNEDCSPGINSTLYNDASSHLTFDSKLDLQNRIGEGDHYATVLDAANDTLLLNKGVYFSTAGPSNLAICTSSSSPIRINELENNCIVKTNCLMQFGISFWTLFPSWITMQKINELSLIDMGHVTIKFVRNGTSLNSTLRNSHSLLLNLTINAETCQWDIGLYTALYGVWTNIVISIDKTTNTISVFYNGKTGVARKVSCFPSISIIGSFYIGGGAPRLCFDEIALWKNAVGVVTAKQLYGEIAFSGYEEFPAREIDFDYLTFDDESGSLWAGDTSNNVYFYHPDQYWMKVEEKMRRVSAGRNGVWAIDMSNKLRFRDGINISSPAGTHWKVVDESSYGSMELKSLTIGFHSIVAFFIKAASGRVYCMHIDSSGTISHFADIGKVLFKLECSKELCCGHKMDGRTTCFLFSSFTCVENALQSKSPERIMTEMITTDSNGHFFRYYNGSLFRYFPVGYKWLSFDTDGSFTPKSLLSMNGQLVVVTTTGKLKILGTGDNVFKIFHSAGRCIKYQPVSRLKFREPCDLFHLSNIGCIKHLATGMYWHKGGDNYLQLKARENCIKGASENFNREPYSLISLQGGWRLAGDHIESFPPKERHLKFHQFQTTHHKIQALGFYFKQVSAFKNINSFYPRKKTKGTPNGELVYSIAVSYRYQDMTYYDSFRDMTGPEAKIAHRKVQIELQQIFAESDSFVKASLGEISSGDNVEFTCVFNGGCPKPLDVKFTALLYFSYLSFKEAGILISDKFNGVSTDCQDNECSFLLDPTQRQVLTIPAKIELINTTSTSLLFRYYPRNHHGAHSGYNVSYTGCYKLNKTIIYHRSFILRDGLLFNISSLKPYTHYNLSVIPLEVQNTGLPQVYLNESTSADVPNLAPGLQLSRAMQNSCQVDINAIPMLNWNGELRGYRLYFAAIKDITFKQRLSFNDNETSNFKNETIDVSISTHTVQELEAFTHYVLYISGYNDAGTGPFARTECYTLEAEPDEAPSYLNVSAFNTTHAVVSWQPLSDDFQIWNTNNTLSRWYKIIMVEISYPRTLRENIGVYVHGQSTSHGVIGPVEPGRVYGFSLKAKNHIGHSNESVRVCLKTAEGVPNAGVKILTVFSNTSSAIGLTVGDMDAVNENGKILYYNISVSRNSSVGRITEFRNASIFDPVIPDDSSPVAVNETCIMAPRRSCLRVGQAYSCPNNSFFLQNTASIMNFTLEGLLFWTEYEIQASACTCAGCGPYNQSITMRTDEYIPTCSTEQIISNSTSSTSLNLTLSPLKKNCTHGIFTGYRVYFGAASSFSGVFNLSVDWPSFNATLSQEKYYFDTMMNSIKIEGLKKFANYCIAVSGSTVKGYGPTSDIHCASTLQDRPEGPPRNVSVKLSGGADIEVSMRPPSKGKANGIILGYVVYLSSVGDGSDAPLTSQESNITVLINKKNTNLTTALLTDLEVFTRYRIEVVAFTSAGNGNRTEDFYYIKTMEGTPIASPNNFTLVNITDSRIDLSWSQVEKSKLKGIFKKFEMRINETLADGSSGFVKKIFLDPNVSCIEFSSRKCYLYNVSQEFEDNATNVAYDNMTYLFSFSLVGLKAYTNYSVELAACTTPGCGVNGSVQLRTGESYPGSAPRNVAASNSTDPSKLILSWRELPILQRNGIIKEYGLRWMKLCDYMNHNNATIYAADCRRVIYDGSNEFKLKIHSSPILETEIANLSSYTYYIFKISARTSVGPGPETDFIALTAEDVPSAPPVVTAAYNTSGKSIRIEWMNIPLPYRNGVILGYTIRYGKTNSTGSNNTEINCTISSSNVTKHEIFNLDLYSYYTFSIGGYTSKGLGVFTQNFTVRTGPYVHGNWSQWLNWGSCSRSCGGGIRIRTRDCTDPSPWNGGDSCKGNSSETDSCNTRLCSGIFLARPGEICFAHCISRRLSCFLQMDLKNSPAKFQELGKQCRDDVTQSSWKLPYHPAYVESDGICAGYKNIPLIIDCNATVPDDGKTRRLCNCLDSADIGFGEWASWSYCSKSCDGGKRTSKRICLHPTGACSGSSIQTKDCNTTPCPVDGNWGQWSAISMCNKTCGYGFQHRYRKCDSPPAGYGGEECYGPSVEYIEGCNPQLCPIHGGWSKWEGTGVCNQACGGGQFIERRYCDNPKPEFGGDYCVGAPNKTEPCNMHQCQGVHVLFWFKLTDFEWDYKYHSLTSSISVELSSRIQKNVLAAYGNVSYVQGIRVKEFRRFLPNHRARRDVSKEYVVANIAIYYSKVTQGEVLYLQDYVSSNGKLFTLNISASDAEVHDVLSGPPRNLSITPLDPHTLSVSWVPPVNISMVADVTGYYVFYREKDTVVGRWDVRGVPMTAKAFNITRLKPITVYKVRMTVSVSYGNGPASAELMAQTPEGAPSKAPENLMLQSIQPSELYVQWSHIKPYYFHGIPLGYIIKYKNYHESSYRETKVAYGASDITLTGLKAYSTYTVIVRGYTAAGVGPGATNSEKTLEGVPKVPPSNVKVKHLYSLDSIEIMWDAFDEMLANGRFKGYRVKYTMIKVSNVDEIITDSSTKKIEVDKYTLKLKLTGLQSYTTYSISVCGFTEAGTGPYSPPILGETCKCPQEIFVNWYENSPYVMKTAAGAVTGIFKNIADAMIKKSCGICDGVLPRINYLVSRTGESPQKLNELQVINTIGPEYHISFPVFGREEMRTFMESHIFVLLVKSTGSGLIVNGAIDYMSKTLNALKSIQSVWPMVLIIILMSLIFGIMLWSVEQFHNEEFSRGRYLFGMCQGLWWAYVSMTTVGYGDITPRTPLGRLIGISWTLIGLVLTGILTGSLTSTVTTFSIPVEPTLYGTTVAVVNNSYEYRLAVRRNSKVPPEAKFQTTSQVLSSLEKKQVDIALLDAFVTASQASLINEKQLKVKKMIPGNAGFGFVLSNEFIRLESDFKSHIASKQDLVTAFVANMTSKLELSDEEPPNIQLFDPKTPAFWGVLKFELILLIALVFLGILWTIFRRYWKRKKVVPAPDKGELLLQDCNDLLEEFHAHMDKKAMELERKHRRELLLLINLKKKLDRHSKRSATSSLWF